MTRILWALLKEKLILPYVDLKTEYYDLGLEHRDATNDEVSFEAARAIQRLGVGVKCATITSNTERQKEYNLKALHPSPNAGRPEAAMAGALEAVCVDSSRQALDHVEANAALNGVAGKVSTVKGHADAVLEAMALEGRRFDVISLDPPAFVKRKKDLEQAVGAYHKVNKLASRLLTPGGLILTASCSQHLEARRFERLAAQALSGGGRGALLLRRGGQGPDHPIHPAMPETDYLKSLLFRVNT
jgi:hypothetical protein